MIGCDITKITRFIGKSDYFVNRVLSLDELNQYNLKTNKIEYLAGRWSAKESIFKATGLRNAVILNNDDGHPYVLNEPNICVTISHDGDYVFTVALDKRNGQTLG